MVEKGIMAVKLAQKLAQEQERLRGAGGFFQPPFHGLRTGKKRRKVRTERF
jgi:hypothetical protein